MAASKFLTEQYSTENILESAGAVIFNLKSKQLCLLYHKLSGEYYLPKGRRNVGESRHAAALREATEETGYNCLPLSINLSSRQPSADETDVNAPDHIQEHHNVSTEPFMVTLRDLGSGRKNLVWWYIASSSFVSRDSGEEQYAAHTFGYHDAVERLTFETDRVVVRKAVEIVEALC